MSTLKSLNEKQKEAARHVDGPLLIIAGAGSGKTRVLTHRIAYLIKEHKVNPFNILAVTFTNKAADEMKKRLRKLVGILSRDMWIGTFHSICGRILRHDIDKIGWKKNFVIYDEDEQLSLIKRIVKDLNFDAKKFNPAVVQETISKAKNNLIGPEKYSNAAGDFFEEKIAIAYKLYQDKLAENNALDFDDMLMYTVMLLRNNPKVLEYYQKRFQYINVDEYQDTNHVQYLLTKLLAGDNGNICVVGDEDQSIYRWRGADFWNILNFEKDFKNAKAVKLEQNYRSTKNVLDVANSVIKNNEMRKDKKLWTNNEEGKKAVHYLAFDEHDEALFLAEKIQKLSEKHSLNDFVILYRTNAQSRVVEDVFLQSGIPYRILSGVRFYERKEIKDILAYLKLIHNPADNLSLIRIINNTQDGIGKVTISKLEGEAAKRGIPLLILFNDLSQIKLQEKTKAKLSSFSRMIARFETYANEMGIVELMERVVRETHYLRNLEDEGTEESLMRAENVKELIGVAKEFEKVNDDKSLGAFLNQIMLVTDQDRADEKKQAVTLMTLHGAKGLEFPVVFIIGMEEGIFPHYRSFFNKDELEEERRLCYVGITRAKKDLFLVSANERTLFGESWCNGPSRFLTEIPEEFLEEAKSPKLEGEREEIWGSHVDIETLENLYNVGDVISHPKFGVGEILGINGQGEDTVLFVDFEAFGKKNLMLKYAPIKKK